MGRARGLRLRWGTARERIKLYSNGTVNRGTVDLQELQERSLMVVKAQIYQLQILQIVRLFVTQVQVLKYGKIGFKVQMLQYLFKAEVYLYPIGTGKILLTFL